MSNIKHDKVTQGNSPGVMVQLPSPYMTSYFYLFFIYLPTSKIGETYSHTWMKHDKTWIGYRYISGDKVIFSKILFSVKSAVRYYVFRI